MCEYTVHYGCHFDKHCCNLYFFVLDRVYISLVVIGQDIIHDNTIMSTLTVTLLLVNVGDICMLYAKCYFVFCWCKTSTKYSQIAVDVEKFARMKYFMLVESLEPEPGQL